MRSIHESHQVKLNTMNKSYAIARRGQKSPERKDKIKLKTKKAVAQHHCFFLNN
jgi:hypothetical protein